MWRSRGWKRSYLALPMLFIGLVLLFSNGIENSSAQFVAPVLDGKLDDAYRLYGTLTRYGDANIHSATGLDDYAAAYLYVLEDDDYVYVFYHQDIFYANDNSYGANSLHWESRPSGMRDFEDIWESDRGEFTFEDAQGGIAAHFYVDQISPSAGTPSGYANLGISGGDGMWLDGYSDPSYFEFSSPMDYNLNSTGYCTGGLCSCGTTADLLTDSPVASGDYIAEAGCEDWQWYNGWEIRVDKDAFGLLGYGVVIGNHHNSPTKTCQKNKDCPTDLYIAYSSIGDRVWYDLDGDGVQDSGEPGLQDVTVNLIDPRIGTIIESQVTDSQGNYVFEQLSHMYYIVQVDESTLPDGFTSTTAVPDPDPANYYTTYVNDECLDDCIQRDGETYANIYYIKLNHPEDYRAADFGYKQTGAAIGDLVWSDANNDGLQDLGEPGIGNVVVELLTETAGVWSVDSSTTTDASGWYLFSTLDPGEYKVQIASSNHDPGQPLDGYTLTVGAESSTNPTGVITLATDEAYTNADFGYYKAGLGMIGDFIWIDSDNEGDQDEAGAGVEGVTVALHLDVDKNEVLDPGEPVIANTITGSDGSYTFYGLDLDEYYNVTVSDNDGVLDGFTITTYWGDDPGEPPLNRYNDPLPVQFNGTTSYLDADFGYNRPGSIGDFVWYDWNNDGFHDPGEIGVGGVTVTLSGDASQITTTAADGSYIFTELESGTYNVSIVTPAGYTLSGFTPSPHNSISLTGNQSYLDADFALFRTSGDAYTLGDLVFYDSDADGYRYPGDPSDPDDGPEPGIENVTLDLYQDLGEVGVFETSEPFVARATTDSSGLYTFFGLVDGNYFVEVSDKNSVLTGYAWTDGTDNTDNYSQVTPYPVTISGGNIVYADFGFDPFPTNIYLASFDAYSHDEAVVVEWETSSETGTIGFNLLRQEPSSGEFVQVNEKLLPGLIHEPQGGTYRYVDEGASPGGQYIYKLVEVESTGRAREYGPFTIEVALRSDADSAAPPSGFSQTPHPRTVVTEQGTNAIEPHGITAELVPPGEHQIFLPFVAPGYMQIPQVTDSAKVVVLEDGLYYLSSDEIAAAMNMHKWEAEELIKDSRLQITHKGKQVAYLPDEGNTGLYFYGWAIQSNYTKENVFWLSDGEGVSMAIVGGEGPSPVKALDPFTEFLHREEEQYAAPGLFYDPSADFWFWDMVMAEDATFGSRTFTISSNGAAPSGSAQLTLHVHALSDTEADFDNHALVSVNGTQVGEFLWDGLNPFSYELYFEQSLLNQGENTIEVTGLLEAGVPYSIFYIDSFDLEYRREYQAVDDLLYAPSEDYPILSIGGFLDPDILVLDVSNPYRPTLVAATTIETDAGASRVSFETGSGTQFLALSRGQLKTPAAIKVDAPSNLSSPANSYDYVVIAPGDWMEEAGTLAHYRQGKGLRATAVNLEDIYDEFNHGLESPYAIRRFLSFAYHDWNDAPQYVVLAGEGTLDYQRNLGYGDNHIPPIMVSTAYGLYPSDNAFVDAVGEDGLADMAIGRLPVSTSVELQSLISKIINYETSSSDGWGAQIYLLADDPDEGGEFPTNSDSLGSLIPDQFTTDRIYLSEKPLTDARGELIDGINSGAAFINYIGHAGPDRFATEGLLTSSDLDKLTNGTKLPVFTTFTCFVGRFELPGYDSIGEALVVDPDGGAIAVWAPTGLSINNEALALGRGLFESLFQHGEGILGDAILDALETYHSGGFANALYEIYTLFGDPALQIKLNP